MTHLLLYVFHIHWLRALTCVAIGVDTLDVSDMESAAYFSLPGCILIVLDLSRERTSFILMDKVPRN